MLGADWHGTVDMFGGVMWTEFIGVAHKLADTTGGADRNGTSSDGIGKTNFGGAN